MTRGERRYRTRRAIDRKVRRYLEQHNGTVDGCYPCQQGYYVQGEIIPGDYYLGAPVHKHRWHMTGVVWEPLLQDPPHKSHKKSIIDRFSDPWEDTRPDRTPKVTDWDDSEQSVYHSTWTNFCSCPMCQAQDDEWEWWDWDVTVDDMNDWLDFYYSSPEDECSTS